MHQMLNRHVESRTLPPGREEGEDGVKGEDTMVTTLYDTAKRKWSALEEWNSSKKPMSVASGDAWYHFIDFPSHSSCTQEDILDVLMKMTIVFKEDIHIETMSSLLVHSVILMERLWAVAPALFHEKNGWSIIIASFVASYKLLVDDSQIYLSQSLFLSGATRVALDELENRFFAAIQWNTHVSLVCGAQSTAVEYEETCFHLMTSLCQEAFGRYTQELVILVEGRISRSSLDEIRCLCEVYSLSSSPTPDSFQEVKSLPDADVVSETENILKEISEGVFPL